MQVVPASFEEESGVTSGQIIGEALRRRGVPDVAIRVLLASLADSTKKQYLGPLIKWKKFCREQNLDFFQVKEGDVLSFLSKLLEDGASFGTLGTARAALSVIAREDLTHNRNISRFMVGVSKLRPPKPKYEDTWDVDDVLKTVSEWFPLKDSL